MKINMTDHYTSEWLKSGWVSWDGCVQQIELGYTDSGNVTVKPVLKITWWF